MTKTNKNILWSLGLVALITLFFWVFKPILTPFAVGIVIAYLLNPLVEKLEAIKVNRKLGSAFLLLIFFMFFGLILALSVPSLVREVSELATQFPNWLSSLKEKASPLLQELEPYTGEITTETLKDTMNNLSGRIAAVALAIVSQIASGGMAIIGMLALIAFIPIVAYEMMVNWPKIVERTQDLIPVKYRPTVMNLTFDIDQKISGFIRGQLSVCFILAVFYVIALSLVGLNYAFIIGILTGLMSFIPMVGALIGLLACTVVAWFQFQDVVMLGLVVGIFFIGQILEGSFLVPKIIGDKIDLHPVWVMFALSACGLLFGFLGLLLALPLAAIAGVLVRFATQRYKQSSYFKEQE